MAAACEAYAEEGNKKRDVRWVREEEMWRDRVRAEVKGGVRTLELGGTCLYWLSGYCRLRAPGYWEQNL